MTDAVAEARAALLMLRTQARKFAERERDPRLLRFAQWVAVKADDMYNRIRRKPLDPTTLSISAEVIKGLKESNGNWSHQVTSLETIMRKYDVLQEGNPTNDDRKLTTAAGAANSAGTGDTAATASAVASDDDLDDGKALKESTGAAADVSHAQIMAAVIAAAAEDDALPIIPGSAVLIGDEQPAPPGAAAAPVSPSATPVAAAAPVVEPHADTPAGESIASAGGSAPVTDNKIGLETAESEEKCNEPSWWCWFCFVKFCSVKFCSDCAGPYEKVVQQN